MGWRHLFPAADGDRGITVSRQTYSDLKISNCVSTVLISASRDELSALRGKLEAHPKIGKLEGGILDAAPTAKIGTFKRPGNAPILTINVSTSGRATTLNMNRLDVQPGN